MKKLSFGTKADTLLTLRKHLSSAQIKPLIIFTVAEWRKDRPQTLTAIKEFFHIDRVVVRSSVIGEDSQTSSHAGEFLSILNVNKNDEKALEKAIDEVIASYGEARPEDQFFVQEQVGDIKMSGVMFTRDMDTLSPYYVINYDDQSGLSDTVTSGSTSHLKTYVRFKHSPERPKNHSLTELVAAAAELEKLFECDHLDIEFAVTRSEEVFVLQVRPIVVKGKKPFVTDEGLTEFLAKVYKKVKKLNAPHPGLYGKKAMYSIMTDWNPAEIIGVRPRMLALSLYKELVTDSIWAYQRNNYGYKNLRSFPLLISFLGLPYIDVRASLNSFVPKDLDDALTGKLVDYYIDLLAQTPTDHDKVEFNVIYSCYYLNLAQKLKKLLNFGFTELELDRLKFSLLSLTNGIISQKQGHYKYDLDRVRQLGARFTEIVISDLSVTDKIYWLVENCKRYGTLPFAGLARAGFIAVQFLRSFIDAQIITEKEFQLYMASLNTVAKQLSIDFASWAGGDLSQEALLDKYGHLRPGTYDILSPRYDEAFDTYFSTLNQEKHDPEAAAFDFSAAQKDQIGRKLKENGIHATTDELLVFIKEAIEGREYSKFLFTKTLSYILLLVEQLGARFELDKESMSHLNIKTVLDLYSNLSYLDLKDELSEDIEKNRKAYTVTKSVRLPQLITSESEIYDFHVGNVEPNFITLSRVTKIVIVEQDLLEADLKDKIVFIKSADPGYDWIFSRKIGGLVTMYGGANSHMAIRCAELKIPAVIGCGEKNFELWSKAKCLELDCGNKQVKLVADGSFV